MSDVILDASAFLALINKEQGYEIVQNVINNSIMSAVNAAEVIAELHCKLNILIKDAEKIVTSLTKVEDFNYKQAVMAASLKKQTMQFGLSLGDRVCLTLGIELGLPVYTANKIWGNLDLNAKIIVIR